MTKIHSKLLNAINMDSDQVRLDEGGFEFSLINEGVHFATMSSFTTIHIGLNKYECIFLTTKTVLN